MRHSLALLERLIREDRAKDTDDSRADTGYWLRYARRHHLRSWWRWAAWITGPLEMWPWTAWCYLRRADAMQAELEAEKAKLAAYFASLAETMSPEDQAALAKQLEENLNPEGKP